VDADLPVGRPRVDVDYKTPRNRSLREPPHVRRGGVCDDEGETPIGTPSAGDAKMVRDTIGEVETETKTKARSRRKMRPFEKKIAYLKR
jgi:hypothetical protein